MQGWRVPGRAGGWARAGLRFRRGCGLPVHYSPTQAGGTCYRSGCSGALCAPAAAGRAPAGGPEQCKQALSPAGLRHPWRRVAAHLQRSIACFVALHTCMQACECRLSAGGRAPQVGTVGPASQRQVPTAAAGAACLPHSERCLPDGAGQNPTIGNGARVGRGLTRAHCWVPRATGLLKGARDRATPPISSRSIRHRPHNHRFPRQHSPSTHSITPAIAAARCCCSLLPRSRER